MHNTRRLKDREGYLLTAISGRNRTRGVVGDYPNPEQR